MAKKPYYLVCYGHVMRVSDRCDTATEALQYCFGTRFDQGVTTERRTGPSWAYISQKQRRAIIIALAQKHYDRTGNVLSGCAGEIKMKKEKKHEPDVPRSEQPNREHEHAVGPDNQEAHGQVHEAERG